MFNLVCSSFHNALPVMYQLHDPLYDMKILHNLRSSCCYKIYNEVTRC